jgi:hypothetical protein
VGGGRSYAGGSITLGHAILPLQWGDNVLYSRLYNGEGEEEYGRVGVITAIGFVAASFKLLNLVLFVSPCLFHPIMAIIAEAAAVDIALAILPTRVLYSTSTIQFYGYGCRDSGNRV